MQLKVRAKQQPFMLFGGVVSGGKSCLDVEKKDIAPDVS